MTTATEEAEQRKGADYLISHIRKGQPMCLGNLIHLMPRTMAKSQMRMTIPMLLGCLSSYRRSSNHFSAASKRMGVRPPPGYRERRSAQPPNGERPLSPILSSAQLSPHRIVGEPFFSASRETTQTGVHSHSRLFMFTSRAGKRDVNYQE